MTRDHIVCTVVPGVYNDKKNHIICGYDVCEPTPEYAHQGIHMLYFLIMNDTRPRHIQKGIDHVERGRASFAENVAATRAGVYR